MVGANFFHLCPSIDGCYNDISCSEQREMIFLNLLLDSKESATFLQVGKHFEKLISSQVFDEKRVCKVGKPCLFTSCVGEPRVGRAKSRELFKARAISHFLVTRLRAVKELYEATLNMFKLWCERGIGLVLPFTHKRTHPNENIRFGHVSGDFESGI